MKKYSLSKLCGALLLLLATLLFAAVAVSAEEAEPPKTVNVKDLGAVADGINDDTPAIHAAVALLRDGDTLYFPSGNYSVRENGEPAIILIEGKKNITIRLEPDAIVQLEPVPLGATGEETRHYIFHLLNCENVTFTGGKLYGDRRLYAGTGFVQHGYGIRLADCKNVTVRGVEIARMRGDGISVFSDTTDENGLLGRCYDITVEDCLIYDCQRNGITLTSVEGFTVRNTEIHSIRGSMPQAAMDIEAEYEGSRNQNIRIENCDFHGNGSWSVSAVRELVGLTIVSSKFEDRMTVSRETQGLRMEDCTLGMVGISCPDAELIGCTINALCLYGGSATCRDCTFDGQRTITYRVLVTNQNKESSATFENCTFVGRQLSALGGCIVFCHTPPVSLTFTDCDFKSCGLIPFIGYLGDVEREGCFFDLGIACWICILVVAGGLSWLIFRGKRKKRWVCK